MLVTVKRLVDDPASVEWPRSRIHNSLNLERRRYLRGLQRLRGCVTFEPLYHDRAVSRPRPVRTRATCSMWTINLAVADGSLDLADATLIARREVLGEPPTRSAAGRSLRARQRRPVRAEQILIAHARAAELSVA